MKKGFTLIELLAVIVILAIIALIATPITLGIINNAKEKAFEQTINGIVKSATIKSTMQKIENEILYKYENNKWVENKLNIDGGIPKYVEIKIDKQGKVRYAITDGEYCAIKIDDNELKIKKISNRNNDKEIQELHCQLDELLPTDDSCFVYSESDDKITITDYNCYKGNTKGYPEITEVVIPEGVTNISEMAFKNKDLTSVIIPSTVEIIGAQAFCDNKLTSILISDGVKRIEELAFSGNLLTSVDIPSSVKKIGNKAFYYNSLTSINIPEGVTSIGQEAFCSNKLTSVTIPKTITSIPYFAFADNLLTSVDIPEGVTSIGQCAFYNNELTSVTIPSSVTTISSKAFYDNRLIRVTIKGKKTTSDFTSYPTSSPFTWASGYSDNDIKWEGSN